jgi:penicillin-binding protein 1C
MSETAHNQTASCPGESAKRVFAQASRVSTPFASADKDVDGRDKPGHDGVGKWRAVWVAVTAFAIVCLVTGPWVISLGPLPLAQASEVSTTIVDRNGKLLRAYAMADGRWRLPVDAKNGVEPTYMKILLA